MSNIPILDSASGRAINQNANRIAQLIQEYDPSLELRWIPPENRTEADQPPYAVWHNSPVGPYQVFTIREEELDSRVIARIYYGDLKKHGKNGPLAMAEAIEAAKRNMARREWEDRRAEAADLAKSILKSPLNTYRHDGKVYR